jgi:hypothetical protein
VYTPILKGKAGEFEALFHASLEVLAGIQPVIELIPKADGHIDSVKLLRMIQRNTPSGLVISLDLTYVQEEQPSLLSYLADHLHLAGVSLRPVVKADDSSDALSVARDACGLHQQGACLRIGSLDRDPSADGTEDRLRNVLMDLDLEVEQVDLLIDFREVGSRRDLDRITPAAKQLLEWSQTRPWRSVTLAAGGFPESVSDLPRDAASALPRYDGMLWTAVTQAANGSEIRFGDYGVAHPAAAKGVPRSPLPSLRYTTGPTWTIYRRATPREAGNARFYDLCAAVVESPHWMGAQYSWGDEQIDRSANKSTGPGNATKWRAYGTSHHLAMVTDRLANLGEP